MSIPETSSAPRARWKVWTGRVLAGLAILFMLVGAAIDISQIPAVVEGLAPPGYPIRPRPLSGSWPWREPSSIPPPAILGAFLLAGVLGLRML